MTETSTPLEVKIEAILFYKGEPVSFDALATMCGVSLAEIEQSLSLLKEKLTGRGLTLVENSGEVMLGTTPLLSTFFETIRKEELTKDLSKASLETLSVILYTPGVTRAEIDYIRGVNSSFILRILQVRGLVDKKSSTKDSRIFVYEPSLELLAHLGVSSVKELPDYEEVRKSLDTHITHTSHEDALVQ